MHVRYVCLCVHVRYVCVSVYVRYVSHGWRSLVQAAIQGVTKSQAQLNDFTFFFLFHSAYKLNKQDDNKHYSKMATLIHKPLKVT